MILILNEMKFHFILKGEIINISPLTFNFSVIAIVSHLPFMLLVDDEKTTFDFDVLMSDLISDFLFFLLFLLLFMYLKILPQLVFVLFYVCQVLSHAFQSVIYCTMCLSHNSPTNCISSFIS